MTHTAASLMRWALQHPMRFDRDGSTSWLNWDGSLLFRMGVAPAAPSVNALYESLEFWHADPELAPIGAVHFYESQYGTPGVDLLGGGRLLLHVDHYGHLSVYSHRELAYQRPYRGWAYWPDLHPSPVG